MKILGYTRIYFFIRLHIFRRINAESNKILTFPLMSAWTVRTLADRWHSRTSPGSQWPRPGSNHTRSPVFHSIVGMDPISAPQEHFHWCYLQRKKYINKKKSHFRVVTWSAIVCGNKKYGSNVILFRDPADVIIINTGFMLIRFLLLFSPPWATTKEARSSSTHFQNCGEFPDLQQNVTFLLP